MIKFKDLLGIIPMRTLDVYTMLKTVNCDFWIRITVCNFTFEKRTQTNPYLNASLHRKRNSTTLKSRKITLFFFQSWNLLNYYLLYTSFLYSLKLSFFLKYYQRLYYYFVNIYSLPRIDSISIPLVNHSSPYASKPPNNYLLQSFLNISRLHIINKPLFTH